MGSCFMSRAQINEFRIELGLRPLTAKRRECLECGKKFRSAHCGCRICDQCKINRERTEETEQEYLQD